METLRLQYCAGQLPCGEEAGRESDKSEKDASGNGDLSELRELPDDKVKEYLTEYPIDDCATEFSLDEPMPELRELSDDKVNEYMKGFAEFFGSLEPSHDEASGIFQGEVNRVLAEVFSFDGVY